MTGTLTISGKVKFAWANKGVAASTLEVLCQFAQDLSPFARYPTGYRQHLLRLDRWPDQGGRKVCVLNVSYRACHNSQISLLLSGVPVNSSCLDAVIQSRGRSPAAGLSYTRPRLRGCRMRAGRFAQVDDSVARAQVF
jgi:hypothetical protein